MIRKVLYIVLAMLIVLMSLPTFSVLAETKNKKQIIGDADGDRSVTISDATMIQRELAKMAVIDDEHRIEADVDNDNNITIVDATTIQRYLAKIIDEFERKPQDSGNENVNEYGLAKDLKQGTIFHAWCWSFNTIKENIKDIAASGFTSIQTSPISQCLVGEDGGMQIYGVGKWYYHYQPTKFVIGNYQLGTKEEFISMCDEAHKYGMKIIVDAVVNHCTSTYEAIDPSIKNISGGAFHEMNKPYWSQEDRYHETQGALSELWDLKTQNPNVQKMIKNYLIDCVNSGADGFRYDTAKLIELKDDYTEGCPSFASSFWDVVLENGAEFQYGENLQDAEDLSVCRLSDYAKIMNVTASKYGERIRSAVNTNNLSVDYIKDYLVDGINPSKLVTWVESHDNYCNENTWSFIDEQESVRAWAIIAARKGGTPLFFSRPDGSTTENPWGKNVIGNAGSDLYKDAQIVEVNFFRNEMGDAEEYLSNPNGNKSVLMIERGQKGCVIVNSSDEDITLNNATVSNMADGVYKDLVSGSTFTVKSKKITGTVKKGRVAVVYTSESDRLTHKTDVSLSVASGDFYTNSLTLTLTANNCTSSYYQINSGTKTAFNNGDILTVGENLYDGQSVKVTLTGTSKDGKTVTQSETYKKCVAMQGTKIYVDKSAFPTWGDLYAYVYNDAGNTNAQWPGVKMSFIGNNKYSYTLPYNLEKGTSYVVFNNGYGGEGNQYPVEDGLTITKNSKMMLNYRLEWEQYPLKTIYFKNTLGWNKVNAYFWGGEQVDWPGIPAAKVEGTDDVYCMTLFGDDTSVIFNNGVSEQTRDISCFIEGQIFTPTGEYTLDEYSQKIYKGDLTTYVDIGLGELPKDKKIIYLRSTGEWFTENNPDVFVHISQDEKVKMTRVGKSLYYVAYIPKTADNIYFTRCDSKGAILNNISAGKMGDYDCYMVTSATKGTFCKFSYNTYPNSWTFYFDNSKMNMATPHIFGWGGDGADGFVKMDYVSGSIYKYTFIVKPTAGETSFLVVDGNAWGGQQTTDLGYNSIYNKYDGYSWSKY